MSKLKKIITYKNITIKLYDVDTENKNNTSNSNIEAFDIKGDLLWKAEKPTYITRYFDMQIDEDKNELEADIGTGLIYIIGLLNGNILRSFVIK